MAGQVEVEDKHLWRVCTPGWLERHVVVTSSTKWFSLTWPNWWPGKTILVYF